MNVQRPGASMSKVTPRPKPFRVRPSRLSKEIRLRRRRSRRTPTELFHRWELPAEPRIRYGVLA